MNITRRNALAALGGAFAARAETRFRTYSRCLPDYLSQLASDAYKARNAALSQLTTANAIHKRQAWVRETFWKLAGGMPERTPLNTRTTGSFEREGYRVENLVYESRPGLHIAANLYLPASGRPPYPGVLFQLGHTLNGKAGDSYQKCCQGLVRLGYVVLSFDPMGQGERTYYPRPGGVTTRLSSADEEHSYPGRQLLLVGDTATRLQVWDAVRSLDVLAAHPQVDPKRLASTGQSGGGTLTMLLAAVDDRLACAAVSSGNTENIACADFNPPGSTDDAEQNFIAGAPLGFDRWDVLYPLAPKPLLITVSDRDYFGTYSPNYLTSGQEEFEKLKRVYAALGHADRLAWGETGLPHGLSYGLRVGIYNFFERHLSGTNRVISKEPPVKIEPDAKLYVGSTGNVVRDFGSKTPVMLARERARGLHPRRVESDELARLLQVDLPKTPRPTVLHRDDGENGIAVETWEVQSAEKVFLPAYVFLPPADTPKKPVLLMLEPGGRTRRWREGDMYHQLAAGGYAVCAFDVRGIGDLSPEVGRGNPFYTRSHSEEEDWAWGAMMLGRPLLGQRVTDILHVASAVRQHAAGNGRKMVLAGAREMATPALCAAALDPRIDTVCASGGMRSWAAIVDADEYQEPLANFVPGILAYTDLPFIRESLGARLRDTPAWTVQFFSAL